MKTELFISWRYLMTKRKEKFISLISIISVMGIAIGVMALIVVIAVMSGFDQDLREKIIGNYSHLTVVSFSGLSQQDYPVIEKKLNNLKHVIGVSPYIQGQLLLKEENRYFAVGLRGIDPLTEPKVTKIKQYLIQGDIGNLNQDGIIIGKELAAYLGLGINSQLTTYSHLGKQRSLKVVGIFNSGMYDYDLNLAFTDIKTAQEVLGLGDNLSAIAIKLDNPLLAQQIKRELELNLGPNFLVKTWAEINQNFFAALRLEKLTMFIILALIILVASFNIISTLVVMVVEKTKDIGILKAMGANSRQVAGIFMHLGFIIGSLGIGLGLFCGLFLCSLLKKYQFIKLPQDIYYIERLPVSIELWPDIALIVLAAALITLVSTIYPARKAAQLEPVEALRYE